MALFSSASEEFGATIQEETGRQPFVAPVIEELGDLSQMTQQFSIPP